MQSHHSLVAKTALYFPKFTEAAIAPILHGGSDRHFSRLTTTEGGSLICIEYGDQRLENIHYAACADFLKKQGINVPEVLKHLPEEKLLWLEDLGEKTLWMHHEAPWKERRRLYELALTQALLFHQIPCELPAASGLMLQAAFDEELYRWEQKYFLDHALGGLLNIDSNVREKLFLNESLQRIARELAAQPWQLIHRDFQSQNIMIHAGEAYFIDFQGMRLGLAAYDIASLLYDPYVNFSHSEREELLSFYEQLAGVSNFRKVFWQCALQRLMQALGAYGFLSLHRNKPHYRQYVAPALASLQYVMTQLDRENQPLELIHELESISKKL